MRKLKESRALSFAVIAVIYIIATIAGVATYKVLGKQSKKEGFAQYISEATSSGVAVIISETTSFAKGKHHSKKPNLSGRQIRLFGWWEQQGSNL